MGWPEVVIAIVLIAGIVKIVRAKHGVIDRHRESYVGRARDDGETERLRAEVRQLKDRVAVIERIVTDGDRNRGLALEREIEALRDEREGR